MLNLAKAIKYKEYKNNGQLRYKKKFAMVFGKF